MSDKNVLNKFINFTTIPLSLLYECPIFLKSLKVKMTPKQCKKIRKNIHKSDPEARGYFSFLRQTLTYKLLSSYRYMVISDIHTVFKISVWPQTLMGKIWVSPASFPFLSYINFGKIVLRSSKFQILFWRLFTVLLFEMNLQYIKY